MEESADIRSVQLLLKLKFHRGMLLNAAPLTLAGLGG